MKIRRPVLLAPLLAGAVLLTGCTAGTPGGDATSGSDATGSQTTAQACTAVGDAVSGAVDAFQQIDPTDPAAAADAFTEISASLDRAAAAVSDSEVSALLPRLQQGFADAADVMTDIAGGDLGRVADLQAPTGEIQDAFGDFAALCR